MARGKADRKRVAEMQHLPRPMSTPVQHLQLSSDEEEGITKIQAMVCVVSIASSPCMELSLLASFALAELTSVC
jgi:hypothetical protein